MTEVEALKAENVRLLAALERYGQHAENCQTNRLRGNEPDSAVCNCGLDDAFGDGK